MELTRQMNLTLPENADNPVLRNEQIVEIVRKVSTDSGYTFDGDPANLTPTQRQIISEEATHAVFNSSHDTKTIAKYVGSLSKVLRTDVSDVLAKRYIEKALKPSWWDKLLAVSGRATGRRHKPLVKYGLMDKHTIKGLGATSYSKSNIDRVTEDAVKVVADSIYEAGPDTIKAFVGDAYINDSEPLDMSSSEAQTLLDARLKKLMFEIQQAVRPDVEGNMLYKTRGNVRIPVIGPYLEEKFLEPETLTIEEERNKWLKDLGKFRGIGY